MSTDEKRAVLRQVAHDVNLTDPGHSLIPPDAIDRLSDEDVRRLYDEAVDTGAIEPDA